MRRNKTGKRTLKKRITRIYKKVSCVREYIWAYGEVFIFGHGLLITFFWAWFLLPIAIEEILDYCGVKDVVTGDVIITIAKLFLLWEYTYIIILLVRRVILPGIAREMDKEGV